MTKDSVLARKDEVLGIKQNGAPTRSSQKLVISRNISPEFQETSKNSYSQFQ